MIRLNSWASQIDPCVFVVPRLSEEKNLERAAVLFPESQGHNLAWTVLCVPYPFDSGQSRNSRDKDIAFIDVPTEFSVQISVKGNATEMATA